MSPKIYHAKNIRTQSRQAAKSQRVSNFSPCAPASSRLCAKNLSLLSSLLSPSPSLSSLLSPLFSLLSSLSSLLSPLSSLLPTPYSLLLLLLLILPTSAYAQGPTNPPSVTEGSALWLENCQPCHGSAGQGDGPSAAAIPNPLPNFANPETARQYVPAQNFDVIKNGRIEAMMPPWNERLSDTQIWHTAAQVWRLGTSYENIDAGEIIYQEQCAACHGKNGAGDGPNASAGMLNFANINEMVQRSQANLQANYQAGDAHANLALSDEELWQALDYIRTFSFAVPARNGVLTGQVINASTGESVGGVEVTLRAFQGNNQIFSQTATANNEGVYTFVKLPTEHTLFYAVEGVYQDILFTSEEPGVFTPNSSETSLNLDVYNTTSNAAAISVSQLHHILNFVPDAIAVVQIFVLNNTGDEVYVGQNGQTFAFVLPANAANIEFQESFPGSRFISTATGYADTAPIIPNTETIIAVQYSIPVNGDTFTLDTPLPANINAVSVMVADQGAELSSEQLQFMDTRSMQGQSYQIYGGRNFNQGDTLSLALHNLNDLDFSSVMGMPPGASLPARAPVNQNMLMWSILGLGGLVIVLAGVVYPLTRPQLAQPANSAYNDDPQIRRQKLLLTLARLDEAFAAGEIDEPVYRQARARSKAELARLMEFASNPDKAALLPSPEPKGFNAKTQGR